MCTEQCVVADVNSKCWRNMFKLEMCLHTRQDRWGMRGGGGGALAGAAGPAEEALEPIFHMHSFVSGATHVAGRVIVSIVTWR